MNALDLAFTLIHTAKIVKFERAGTKVTGKLFAYLRAAVGKATLV